MDFGANLVKIGHRSPEIEKLESFEEDGQEITERQGQISTSKQV